MEELFEEIRSQLLVCHLRDEKPKPSWSKRRGVLISAVDASNILLLLEKELVERKNTPPTARKQEKFFITVYKGNASEVLRWIFDRNELPAYFPENGEFLLSHKLEGEDSYLFCGDPEYLDKLGYKQVTTSAFLELTKC